MALELSKPKSDDFYLKLYKFQGDLLRQWCGRDWKASTWIDIYKKGAWKTLEKVSLKHLRK
jgi:hypothetical protein